MLCIKQCSALAVALAVEKPDACLLGSYQGPPVLLKEAPEVAPRFLDIQNGPVPHNIKSQWTPLIAADGHESLHQCRLIYFLQYVCVKRT